MSGGNEAGAVAGRAAYAVLFALSFADGTGFAMLVRADAGVFLGLVSPDGATDWASVLTGDVAVVATGGITDERHIDHLLDRAFFGMVLTFLVKMRWFWRFLG